MRGVLDFEMDQVDGVLDRCTRFILPDGVLTAARGAYLSQLIAARKEALRAVIGG